MKKRHFIFSLLLSFSFVSNALHYANEDKSLFIVGSTSLAKVLTLSIEPFYQQTGISLVIRPIGSDKGIVSIAEGVSDISIISRFMTDAEMKK